MTESSTIVPRRDKARAAGVVRHLPAAADRAGQPDQPAPCPHCGESSGGRIFQDARGGFECTCCDARFHIWQEPPFGYGGPGGPLSWRERETEWLERCGWTLTGTAIVSLSETRWTMGTILSGVSFLFLLAARGWKVTWKVP